MAGILGSYVIVRRWVIRQEDVIDNETITPSDYTVWVKGLPSDFKTEDLETYLKEHGRADGKVSSIVKINVPIDIWEFVTRMREVNTIKRKLLMLEKGWAVGGEGCCCWRTPAASKEELENRLKSAMGRLQKLETSSENRRLQQAFVTFATQTDADLVLESLTATTVQRFFQRICGQGSFESPIFQGKRLYASKPPDPSDILWENLYAKIFHRLKHMALTSFITLLMLAACGGMIYGCSYYKYELNKDYKRKTETDSQDLMKFRVSSILPAIGVIFINFVLSRSIRRFSLYEKSHTSTQYNISVAFKLILAMCINTALIPILVENDKNDNWFTPGGLAVEMTLIYITNTIVPPILYLFSPMYLVRLIRRCRARRHSVKLFQAEANAIFEGPQVDMAQRYANVLKTLIISFAYAPLVPIGLLFGCVALVVSYWVDKVILLRRHARPQRMSGDLAKSMLRVIPWAVVVYAVMNFVFIDQLNSDYSSAAFVWMWITIGVALFPTSAFRGCFKRSADLNLSLTTNTKDYASVAVSFLDDFDRSNPFTQREGWMHYLKLLQQKKLIDEKGQKELMEQVRSTHSFVENYARAGTLLKDTEARREWRPPHPLEVFQLQMLNHLSSDTSQSPHFYPTPSLPPTTYFGPMLYSAGYYGQYSSQVIPQQSFPQPQPSILPYQTSFPQSQVSLPQHQASSLEHQIPVSHPHFPQQPGHQAAQAYGQVEQPYGVQPYYPGYEGQAYR